MKLRKRPDGYTVIVDGRTVGWVVRVVDGHRVIGWQPVMRLDGAVVGHNLGGPLKTRDAAIRALA